METNHEVIEEDLPEWAKKAFMEGTLFRDLGAMIDAAYKQGVTDTQYRTVVLEKSIESVQEICVAMENDDLWGADPDTISAVNLQQKMRRTHHLLVAVIEASGIKKGD